MRKGLLALLLVWLLVLPIAAQRGGGFRGGGASSRGPVGPRGTFGRHGGRNGVHGFSRSYLRYRGYGNYPGYGWGSYFLPDFWWDDEGDWGPGPEQAEPPLQSAENGRPARPGYYRPPEPEKPPAEAQVINIPAAPGAAEQAKNQPPATFVLKNGERLEARRFLLTANNLSVTVDHTQRTIPFDSLDVDATLAANRDRGVNLEIPADHNEISLSF
jgi:hypothetical protein